MSYTKGNNVTIGNNVMILDGCHIGDNVVIEDNVYIDYNCIIRSNVHIKEHTTIGVNCILGEYTADWYGTHSNEPALLTIGAHTVIRSDSIIYSGSSFGDYFQTGHRVTVREGTKIGNYCSLGTLSDVQGECSLGDYVRCHSNVHIGQGSTVNNFIWIYPYVVLTNDPTPPSEVVSGVIIDNYAVVATSSTILPGVRIHSDTLVAAGATVSKDVEKNTVVGGTPAKVICNIDHIRNHESKEAEYPWRYQFRRGMPWADDGFDKWYDSLSKEQKEIYKVGD